MTFVAPHSQGAIKTLCGQLVRCIYKVRCTSGIFGYPCVGFVLLPLKLVLKLGFDGELNMPAKP